MFSCSRICCDDSFVCHQGISSIKFALKKSVFVYAAITHTCLHRQSTMAHECRQVCYAMPCYAMPCYAMLCHAMLCYAMLCYAMLCYAMLCYAMLRHAMPCTLHLAELCPYCHAASAACSDEPKVGGRHQRPRPKDDMPLPTLPAMQWTPKGLIKYG